MAERLYAIPISERPKERSWLPHAIAFGIVFDVAIICIHGLQWMLQPLRLLFPVWPGARVIYDAGIGYTKTAFGSLLVFMCQVFAPCKFVITFEGSDNQDNVFGKDSSGNVTSIKVPDKLVIMSNHQMYCDWMYLWCLMYFMNAQSEVLIILKKSLKHIPIIGWGMQFYHFLFLARSWSTDQMYLRKKFVKTAERAKAPGDKLALMIFPEGTLVSRDTRPLSKKFADKIGIADLDHTLLPRSTGLLFLLRSICPTIPDLQLLDVTIGYPGIPRKGYGQEYYTLRSVFFQGIPPPKIHIHLRVFKQSEIPFGEVSSKDCVKRGGEATTEEAAAFEDWLRKRWTEKDQLMERFYSTGSFSGRSLGGGVNETDPVEIPIRLRSPWEAVNAFAFFAPILVYWGHKKFW